MAQPAPTLLLPHAAHFSEFAGGFNGTCTQTALTICMGIATGKDATQAEMLAITHDMIDQHMAGANGATTVAAVAAYARQKGFTIDTEWDFGSLGDWHQKLKDTAGHKPILLQIANGQALVDAETGARDESGLHYHAIAVVGYQTNGYLCADGDNPQVADRFQLYSYPTLLAAQPSGLLILDVQVDAPPPLPDGALLVNGVLTWGGYQVTAPFLPTFEARHYNLGPPLSNAWTQEGVSYQTFTYGELRSNAKDGVFLANIGADLLKFRAILAKIKGDLG